MYITATILAVLGIAVLAWFFKDENGSENYGALVYIIGGIALILIGSLTALIKWIWF